MTRWTEYDPFTQVRTTYDTSGEGSEIVVSKVGDVTEVVEATKAIANSGATDIGIKKGLWHYCSIPQAVQYEMLTKHGVNIHDRNHWSKVFDLVNKEYPYLKTTTKTHAHRNMGKVYTTTSLKPLDSSSPETQTAHGNSLIIT
jgi:hypothetical protein